VYQCTNANRGSHSYLKGHIISFDNDISNSVQVLPRSSESLHEILKVVFIGPNQAKYGRLPKVNQIRTENLHKALVWLKENKVGYQDIQIQELEGNEIVYHPIEGGEEVEEIQRRIPLHARFEIEDEELVWRHSRGELIETFTTSGIFTSPSLNEDQLSLKIKASMNTWFKHLDSGLTAVTHGGTIKDINGNLDWIQDMYPSLFPYGITGPQYSNRPREISLQGWVVFLLRNTNPQFRRHHDFIFTMFNIMQRANVTKATRYS
jgi:hypothetical protein